MPGFSGRSMAVLPKWMSWGIQRRHWAEGEMKSHVFCYLWELLPPRDLHFHNASPTCLPGYGAGGLDRVQALGSLL